MIIELQQQRQRAWPGDAVEVQLFDRSPLCTLALARYLGQPTTSTVWCGP